jgi:DNA sulfur modification protein DndD
VVENFRSYRERQTLDLTVTASSNVIVVYGENMRGKTTLLQALRWCLYGTVRDRSGGTIPVVDASTREQLASRHAVADGERLYVALDFVHEGSDYSLIRQAALGTAQGMAPTVSLEVDGAVVDESQVSAVIGQVLREDISRFFLFDGEMLTDYERLLRDDDHEARTVRDAIESILGLPALRLYRQLEALKDDAHKRLRRESKRDDRNAGLAAKEPSG